MSRVSLIIAGGQTSVVPTLLLLSQDKNIKVDACVTDLSDIFCKLTEAEPTILLIDFSVVYEAHYATLTQLRRSHPNAKVILLCEGADPTKLVDAFRHGASGFLEAKDCDVFLAKAIHAVSNGEAWVPRHFVAKIVERLRHSPL
jgi:DNA-binding NarL/FixJ family response regulator